MTLTTRLLLFFQAALAIVLLLFCVTLYSAARWYVHHQATDSVERATATLVGSVDIEADSVEWEPSDRELSLGPDPLGGTVYWFITDARAQAVDQSEQPGMSEFVNAAGTDSEPLPNLQGWVATRRVVHPPGASGGQLTRDRTVEEIEKGEYPALVFTVGVRTGPVHSVLNALAAALVCVSLLIWLAALAVGRRVCQHALRPVAEMAASARAMRADAQADLPRPAVRGELDELHAAISDLLTRLREALERERRFTGEASHQLRTPLGTILGQVEVALRKPRSTEEYERVLVVVRKHASHLVRSVEALLFLARSKADSPPLETLDLRQWVPEFVESFADHPRRADLSFEVKGEGPLAVAAHPALWRELVGNLVDNALKYTSAGSPVVVRARRTGDEVEISVEDRGTGIPSEDLAHIFEPFFRSEPTRRASVPGAGLGLAVVARIASAFGGRVTVENRTEGGARFTITLPAPMDEENFISASRMH